MAKSKSSVSKGYLVTTVVIYLFLAAAIGTYLLPFQGVTLPAIGKKVWSVQDIVRTIPKSLPIKKEQEGVRKFDIDFDFIDFVKEVTPKRSETQAPIRVSPQFLLGSLMPFALALAYLFLFLGLFVAPLKKGAGLIACSLASFICSVYVLAGTYYLSFEAKKAFTSSLAKVEESPFAVIAKNFIQKVNIQPEIGLFLLIGFTALILVVSFYRRNQSS